MIDKFWNQIEDIALPAVPELENLNIVENRSSSLLFQEGEITDQYLKIWRLYQCLFGYYVIAQSGLDRLVTRLAEQEIPVADEAEKDFYQKYDTMGLAYFYLRSFAHIERLSDEEIQCLKSCIDQKDQEEALQRAGKVVEDTYRKVMAVKPESGDKQVELFPSVYGEGNVPGDAIVIGMSSSAEYDEQGMLLDAEKDKKRIGILYSVKDQLEPILSRSLGTKVVVLVSI